MVLERYLSRFLEAYIGRYVKGLDSENVRLSVSRGESLYKDLSLVPEALSELLGLQVDVKWGHVGLFHLRVPWTSLGSKPVCVTLEDVYILAAPLDTWSMDDMERQRRARYQKYNGVEARLKKHAERKKALLEGISTAAGAAGGKGMMAKLMAKFVDNIQITVKNIHIRYEDELSLDNGGVGVEGGVNVPRPLSIGVTLRELVMQTVDENWTPTSVQGDAGTGKGGNSGGGYAHKLVSVDSLAVYCDGPNPSSTPHTSSSHASKATTKSEHSTRNSGSSTGEDTENGSGNSSGRSFLAAWSADKDLLAMFRASLAGGEGEHSYVVIPASPIFRLRLQKESGGDGGAWCKVEAFFNEVGVVLNNAQIANMNKMRSTLRDLERWEALYRHRPKHSIKDGPKAWWSFLVKCVSRHGKAGKRAKLGWLDVVRLLALRKLYVRLYTARARHQASPEEYQQFTRLDEQLTANEIVAFRLKAIAELEEEDALSAVSHLQQQQAPRQTWGEWLLRRDPAGAGTTEEGSVDIENVVQGEDAAAQAEFLRAFAPGARGGGDEDADPNRVLWDVEASLNEGALTLVNGGQPCLRIIFDVTAELKKKKADWRLEMGLGALQMFGLGREGGRATTLLTRRTWRPQDAAAQEMIQIGDFQVWKSGGVVVDYRSDPDHRLDDNPDAAAEIPPHDSSSGGAPSASDRGGEGAGGSLVIVKVVFAPHQLMHNRSCVDQVTSMLATRDMRLLTSAAQSKISRLQRATRSSFLHALGENQRFEVTADIHAPLLVIPDTKEHSPSSLLVVDLGHIAFRRDDTTVGSSIDISPGDNSPVSPIHDVDTDRKQMVASYPLGGSELDLVAENDWRLDVSGVQLVVADGSSFFGEQGGQRGGKVAAAAADTAIIEGFDVHVKIRTSTDRETNRLVGLSLQASLPRLSFNVHSSAYLLLSRLLKSGMSRPSAREDPGSMPASVNTSSNHAPLAAPGATPVEAVTGVGASQSSPGHGKLGRDRAIKTVLSSELEPVTEVPGEGPGEPEEGEWDGAAGGVSTPRTSRRNSGSRRHRRRRSSSGSCSFHGPIFEQDEVGGDGVGKDAKQEGVNQSEEDVVTEVEGLTLEVRLSAPVICVLLVHDNDRGSHDQASAAVVTDDGAPLPLTTFEESNASGTSDALPTIKDSGGRLGACARNGAGGNGGAIEGALVLVEIYGLGVEYRDIIGGGDGVGHTVERRVSVADREAARIIDSNQLAHSAWCCLTVASFRVQDMHQQAGDEFSYLLSSSPPPIVQTGQSGGGTKDGALPSEAPADGLQMGKPAAENSAKITVEFARRSAEKGGVGGKPSNTVVSLAGLWANWNPETVAALSIFAYGMYGNGIRGSEQADDGGHSPTVPTPQGDAVIGEVAGQGLEPFTTTAARGRHVVDADRGVRGAAPGETAVPEGKDKRTLGGRLVVEVKQISLWLNKEVYGRRLLLLEAGESKVELSKDRYSEGSVSHVNIVLASASLTDLGTKDSRWRSLVSPSQNPVLPRQEVRISIEQDSRHAESALSLKLVLQSCVVNYVNQSWIEALDYVMNGVLGDGPWCPWLLVPQDEDGNNLEGGVTRTSPVLKKKRLTIEATDPEVVLPAGYVGEGWVAVDGKRLVASNSYGERAMGDSPQAQPELCQIWTVKLEGVGIRSSSNARPTTMGAGPRPSPGVSPRTAQSTVLGTDPTAVPRTDHGVDQYEMATGSRIGSRVAGRSALAGDVTVEARWPIVPKVGGPEHDGRTSNYVVEGLAPGLDLDLHADDVSILWQVVGENIAGVAPEPATLLSLYSDFVTDNAMGERGMGGIRRNKQRKQVTLFPYDNPSPIATTFDISFQLPDIALVAHGDSADEFSAADVGDVAGCEVGTVRSRLLKWRMLRFSDFRSSNEVILQAPCLTETVPLAGARELLGSGPDIPLNFHETRSSGLPPPEPSPKASTTTTGSVNSNAHAWGVGGDSSKGGDGELSSPCSSFRWKKRSWPDGGRTTTLAVEGGGVLLSKRGWGRWRHWAAGKDDGGTGGNDDAAGDLHVSTNLPTRETQQPVDKQRAEIHGSGGQGGRDGEPIVASPNDVAKRVEHASAGAPAATQAVGVAETATNEEAKHDDESSLIAELASSLSISLSGTCVVLEPWDYGLCESGKGAQTRERGGRDHNIAGPAVVLRADLSVTSTSAFFLDGHWTPDLGVGAHAIAHPMVAGDLLREENDSAMTTLVCCKVAMLEAFSRPARRLLTDVSAASLTARSNKTVPAHPNFTDWRTVLEPAAGTVTYAFAPPHSPETKNAEDAHPLGVGCKRLSAQGWSAVKAVVRPSDILTAARALWTAEGGEVDRGGNVRERNANERVESKWHGGQAEREQSSADSPLGFDTPGGAFGTVNAEPVASWAAVGEEHVFGSPSVTPLSQHHMSQDQQPLSTPVDLDVRAAGGGITLRLEDDSGTHFTPPARPLARSRDRMNSEQGRTQQGSSYVSPKQTPTLTTSPVGSFPQPVAEANTGAWEFAYSRTSPDSGRQTVVGARDADICRVESAKLSMSALTVADLLQREPCHSAFRELLAIAAPAVPQTPLAPSRDAPSEEETQEWTMPTSNDPPRREGWLEETEGAKSPSGSGLGTIPLNEPLSSPPTAVTASHSDPAARTGSKDVGQTSPSVVIEYRKVMSFSSMSRLSSVTGYAQATAESSGEEGRLTADAARTRNTSGNGGASSERTAPNSAAAECPPSRPVAPASRTTVSVDLGGSITVNWNPRTMPALWGVHAALSSAWASGSIQPLESGAGGTVKGVGTNYCSGKIDDGVVVPSCATEILVGAHHGIKVKFNKEREGRQLMEMSAACLDVAVDMSSCGEGTDTAVVWQGRLDDLKATDPRASNVFYSALVGPSLANVNTKAPSTPVVLSFRYAKEGKRGCVAALPGVSMIPTALEETPWESSTLSLSLSECTVVYFQPLWLEAIDFLWEGVLGSAVWGSHVAAPAPTKAGTPTTFDSRNQAGDAAEEDGASSSFGKPGSEGAARGGLRSLSAIDVTLAAPTVVLPGALVDPSHLALTPSSAKFSTWTGGASDGNAPPHLEDCSPNGPVARHMVVEAPNTRISLGSCIALDSQGVGTQLQPLLRDPADVKVTLTSSSAKVHTSVSSGESSPEGGGDVGSASDGVGVGGETKTEPGNGHGGSLDTVGVGVQNEDAVSQGAQGSAGGADDSPSTRSTHADDLATATNDEERSMCVRVCLPRLSFSLSPTARATLTACIGGNILASGFHGEISENFPLDGSLVQPNGYENQVTETEEGLSPSVGGSGLDVEVDSERAPPLRPTLTTVDSVSGDGPVVVACATCAMVFDELVARRSCSWCGDSVCTKCMHTQVLATNDGVVGRNGGLTGSYETTSTLVCDACAARTFPETSVRPSGEIRFRYGDDGPVTAIDLELELPGIRMDLLPVEGAFPVWEATGGEHGRHEAQFPPPSPNGTMSVETTRLELTYKRSARRRGGLEASVAAVTVTDLSPGAAFSLLVAPAPAPAAGESQPSQLVLSYHFSPITEARIQVMINHLEAILVSSAFHKLKAIVQPPPSGAPTFERDAPGPGDLHAVQGHRARDRAVLVTTHDLAALQLVHGGAQEVVSRKPFTVNATLLNPVLMFPQDDQDPGSHALFLKGLVIAQHTRSPRYDQVSEAPINASKGAKGEARETTLKIFRLESWLGRMFGGSGRGRGGIIENFGGMGTGAGAIDPVTLNLHYSEVEKPLRPMVKNLNCQVIDSLVL